MESEEFREYVRKNCSRHSDNPFLSELQTGRRITYSDFWAAVSSSPAARLGLKRGQNVILPLKNDIHSIIALFALLVQGVRPVLVSPRLPRTQLLRAASQAHADILATPWQDVSLTNLPSEFSPSRGPDLPADIAYLVFTSGSTGAPKGIKITYENILLEIRSMLAAYQLGCDDVHLCVLPIYHASGLYRNVLMAFEAGSESFIASGFDARHFWQILDQNRVTFTQINPTIISSLLANADAAYSRPKSIRFVGSASAPHPPRLVREFEARLGLPLAVGYGMTEATCGITLNNDSPRRNYGVGKPIDACTVDVVGADGAPLSPWEQGELVVQGLNVMAGYLSPEEHGGVRCECGALHTGDLGYKDSDGYVYVSARKDNIVKRAGYRLNTTQIETAVCAIPCVEQCSVVPIPHPVLGTDIVGFVVMSGSTRLTSREIIAELKGVLAAHEMPSEFVVLGTIPNTASGKIDRDKLLAYYDSLKRARCRKEPTND